MMRMAPFLLVKSLGLDSYEAICVSVVEDVQVVPLRSSKMSQHLEATGRHRFAGSRWKSTSDPPTPWA